MKRPLSERLPRFHLLGFGCLLIALLGGFRATHGSGIPTVQPGYSAYFPGEEIQVRFANGPGNPKDWVGIYQEGQEPGGGTGSTLWYYVDGTQAGTTGLKEGAVVFANGLQTAGTWWVYLLLNDGYTKLASNSFTVVESYAPAVRPDKSTYGVKAPIAVTFTNAPGNAKDWVGIYKEGQVPGGGPTSTLWAYVDGTQNGNSAKTEGTVEFSTGLDTAGIYVAYLLENDGYTILASNAFQVVVTSSLTPRLLSATPSDGSANQPPVVPIQFVITNGASSVLPNTVVLTLDGTIVPHKLAQPPGSVVVTYTNTVLFAPASTHQAVLTFADNANPQNLFTNRISFTVGNYQNIVLPDPIYLETFDATPEGQLPTGWTEKSYTEVGNAEFDLGNLDSASYATWTVVDAARFAGSFVTYSNPDAPQAEKDDYHRVLSINPMVVVNGKIVEEPLAKGRFLFANSGYRNGASQVLYAFSPDYNLTGKTQIYVSFHSIYEQNQDNIAAVEYSIDQGAHWLPALYMLDGNDLLFSTNATGTTTVDAVATLTTEADDIARYVDELGEPKGGTYGAFLAAPITQDLAPFINARVNDDPVESKRVELIRLPQADNQAKVRLRFAYAGSDSWYFGIDNLGLYSISDTPPTLSIAVSGSQITISWPSDATGFTLETSIDLGSATWSSVPGVVGNSVTLTPGSGAHFYRLKK